MKYTRRRLLRDASALSALAIGASGLGSAADCSSYSAWQSDTAYTDGDRVVYNDALWEAQWWTQANEPEMSDSVWVKVGPCDGSGGDGGDGGDGGTSNSAPTASFSASSLFPAPGESVSFDASDSSDSDGSVASYDWTFGDGASGSGGSVSHSYGSDGDYTVTLTVTDDDGATGTATRTISVGTTSSSGSTAFAPYNDMSVKSGTTLTDIYGQASNDTVTAAFVLSDGSGNAAWGGSVNKLVGEAGYGSEIQSYQDAGGTVIVSFGGAMGTMIAQDTTDVSKIRSEYEKVMDTYGVTHLDFDIESVNTDAVDRRNQALSQLQSDRPDLSVSYTLRCKTTGLTSHGKDILNNAVSHGVDVDIVNIMTMDYGWVEPSASTIEDSANGTHDDIVEIFSGVSSSEAWGMVGITPMIGANDAGGTHHLDDAQQVASFVVEKGIGRVAFWSIDRDNGGCPDGTVWATCSGIAQDPYEFSNIYNQVQ